MKDTSVEKLECASVIRGDDSGLKCCQNKVFFCVGVTMVINIPRS